MVVVVLTVTTLTAAYLIYKKQKQANLTLAGTTLKDKESITLLPMEDEVNVFEMPIGTITYFAGNYKDEAAPYVKERLKLILEKNPWLAGWLVLEKTKVKIYYKASTDDIDLSRNLLIAEPGQVEIGKPNVTSFDKLVPTLLEAGAVVENNMNLIGKDKPIFQVSIIPDVNDPDHHFALVVSMSHAVGDPHTYYKILAMLDNDTPVEALTATRNESYPNALLEKVGKEEYYFLMNALDETTTIDEKKQQKMLEAEKKKQLLNDPIVTKVFYLKKDWLVKSHATLDSFLETNVPAPQPGDKTFAAHAVLSSWFFKANQADVAVLPYNQRGGRLAAQECELDDTAAGNYTHTVLYTKDDYASGAANLQLSMAIPAEAASTAAPAAKVDAAGCVVPGAQKLWRVLKRAPKLDANGKVSVLAPWAVAHFGKEISLGGGGGGGGGCQQELQLLLLNSNHYSQVLAPGGMSLMLTFVAVPKTNAANAPPRAGIFCMCKQSVWKQIQDCGIVDEYIFDG